MKILHVHYRNYTGSEPGVDPVILFDTLQRTPSYPLIAFVGVLSASFYRPYHITMYVVGSLEQALPSTYGPTSSL